MVLSKTMLVVLPILIEFFFLNVVPRWAQYTKNTAMRMAFCTLPIVERTLLVTELIYLWKTLEMSCGCLLWINVCERLLCMVKALYVAAVYVWCILRKLSISNFFVFKITSKTYLDHFSLISTALYIFSYVLSK